MEPSFTDVAGNLYQFLFVVFSEVTLVAATKNEVRVIVMKNTKNWPDPLILHVLERLKLIFVILQVIHERVIVLV